MNTVDVKIFSVNDSPLPQYATPDSNGLDLLANITEPITLGKYQRVLVPCGIKIEMPSGYAAWVTPRSGLALKHGVTVTNSPGLIDNGFRGEIAVILENLNDLPFIIEPNMRVAQLVVVELPRIQWIEVDQLGESVRGENGYGSTGF